MRSKPAKKLRRGCGNKVRHKTSRDAYDAKRLHVDGDNMNVYKCQHCGYYHIGHKTKEHA